MFERHWKSLSLGLKRRWKRGLRVAFGALGVLSAVVAIVVLSDPVEKLLKANSHSCYVAASMVALIAFISTIYEPRNVSFKLPTTDTVINIAFGDLFKQECSLVVGVNEFFDATLGDLVAPNSVHGQFIIQRYGSDEARFRHDVDIALTHTAATQTNRIAGPQLKYPIGTTAVLQLNPHKAFLVAMAHTDPQTGKASASVPLLWEALQDVLEAICNHGNGHSVAMPLIGNSFGRVNLEPQHLLRLIVLAIVDFGRRLALPKQIFVILHESCFPVVDIREIARDWSKV